MLITAVWSLLNVAAPAATHHAGTLDWLAGCWENRSAGSGRLVEEHWLAPRAGGLIGVSRTSKGDELVEFEFLRIAEKSGALTYFAQPSGQSPAEFQATLSSGSEVVFRNPAHDFPQQIRYQRLDRDELRAEISGPGRDGPRTIGWTLKRVACPAGDA